MNFPAIFPPPRQRGLLLNTVAVLLFGLATAASFSNAFNQPVGSNFVLLLLLAALLCVPVVLILYRIYALLSASYAIERDGLRLRWGLRAEDIPISDIEWVRPVSDLALPLPKPLLSWPGALIGSIRTTDLGVVEFMASESGTLLLVATPAKIYAVSPADPGGFTSAFRRTTELGSLLPIPSYSTRPAAYVTHVWQDRAARILTAAGLLLAVILFVAVSLGVGDRATIPLGFGPDRLPLEPVPAVQALLLPVLAGMAYAADLILGFLFYRREERRPLAYLLWAGGVITPLTFLIAAFFVL